MKCLLNDTSSTYTGAVNVTTAASVACTLSPSMTIAAAPSLTIISAATTTFEFKIYINYSVFYLNLVFLKIGAQ